MSIQKIYSTTQTVFDLKDLSVLLWVKNKNNLKAKVSYYAKKWYLYRVRQGIYTKKEFHPREFACKIYTPSYISFESILQDAGVIYQLDNTIYLASYLSRTLQIDTHQGVYTIQWRKIKDALLYKQVGIQKETYRSQATSERAIKDMLYIKPDFYFDKLSDDLRCTHS